MADNKIDIVFLGLCDLASITREGKLNIFGVFEQMYVRQFPTHYVKFSIVGIVKGKSESQSDLSLRIVDPEGEEAMPKQNVQVKIGGNGKANMIFDVVNLPISKPGVFKVELREGDSLIGESQLQVVKVNPPQQGQVS